MTCKRLSCLIFGHNWLNDLVYRTYGTKLGSPSTGFQLFCTRSYNWVKVSRRVFDKFYDNQLSLIQREGMASAYESDDGQCDCQEGVIYCGEDENFGNY